MSGFLGSTGTTMGLNLAAEGAKPLLQPMLTLLGWTFVIEGWMYATRLPALSKYDVKVNPEMKKEDMNDKLPAPIRWKADNYNHLNEQPPVFYAATLALCFLGGWTKTDVSLAWTYVGLRVGHSLLQCTVNEIMPRFYMFASSSIVAAVLTGRAAMAAFQ